MRQLFTQLRYSCSGIASTERFLCRQWSLPAKRLLELSSLPLTTLDEARVLRPYGGGNNRTSPARNKSRRRAVSTNSELRPWRRTDYGPSARIRHVQPQQLRPISTRRMGQCNRDQQSTHVRGIYRLRRLLSNVRTHRHLQRHGFRTRLQAVQYFCCRLGRFIECNQFQP